jgi:uncharacterized protein (TIGR01777 family)
MARFEHQSTHAQSADTLYRWLTRPGALERLLPPWLPLRLEHEVGDELALRAGVGPVGLPVRAQRARDEAKRSVGAHSTPGARVRWELRQRVEPRAAQECALVEELEAVLPGGARSEAWLQRRGPHWERIARFRAGRVRSDLARHAASGLAPQTIAVSGATGLLGRQLSAFLEAGGHRVRRLVRSVRRTGAGDIYWNPERGEIEASELENLDAVIHLAGEGVADGRWTEERRRRIRASRVDGTRLLAQALVGLQRPPRTLVCASAIGIYGDRGEAWVDVASKPGGGFLADVVEAWEAAAQSARARGLRVVQLRFGMLLSARGGALGRMLPAFRLGLGGPLGSGGQFVSWLSLEDALALLLQALWDERLAGPLDAVSPRPVTQRELAATLGHLLGRPARLAVPGALLRGALGQMAQEMLLGSTRVRPSTLESLAFPFEHPDLESALRCELGRERVEPTREA